ncbi:hypothetical protein [Tritonibacter horizontis]|uniref:Uncharacterized protein n=1 Tax=Tritonibacter horizontis TaxID=1768241 RepID=A0A132BZB7_9RHOB|nr:hypothetical protein [Tritonibacter horizontis]KUP93177.1 hypothetical protein TRIHO_19630 [Tritonibacter horizontis]
MKVILHIGAHRCATRSFQKYMARKGDHLAQYGLACMGPERTRTGFLHGIQPGAAAVTGRDLMKRAQGRISLHLGALQQAGTAAVVISDANMLGPLEQTLSLGQLYPGAGEHLSRLDHAFSGKITDVMLNIRSPEVFWASALSVRLEHSQRMSNGSLLSHIASSPRSWRDVIQDLYCAIPGARIRVFAHEVFASQPEAQLSAVTGVDCPAVRGSFRLNASAKLPELRCDLPPRLSALLPDGDGRWMPFSAEEAARLRESYYDDMMWLVAGADGLAELVEDPNKSDAVTDNNNVAAERMPQDDLTRGQLHDPDTGRLAGAG